MGESDRRTSIPPGTWEELDREELKRLFPDSTNWPQVAKCSPPADEATGMEPGEAPSEDAAPAPHDRTGWPPAWRREPPQRDLFGLALSGGGIRSATFNLGVLQELAKVGLLDCFHYLSTVSGGGYIGGFWSAWKTRTSGTRGSFPGVRPVPGQPEAAEVRHLREFSNFLRPRSSLFEIETARMVSAVIAGVVPSILITFALILLVLGGWWTLAWWFSGAGPGALRPPGWPALPWAPAVGYGLVTGAVLWIAEARLWKRSKPDGESPKPRERGGYWIPVTMGVVFCSVLAAGVWFLAPSPTLLLIGIPLNEWTAALGNALFPSFPWWITAFLLLGVRVVLSASPLFPHEWSGRMRQAALDRTMTRLALTALVWSTLGATWVGGQLLAESGVSGVLGAFGTGGGAGGLFAWLRRTMLTQSNDPTGRSVRLRLGTSLYQILAYVALIAIAAGGVATVVVVFTRFGGPGLLVMAVAVGIVLFSMVVMDPHEIGLHKFYRARLVRAYLGPSNVDGYPRGTAEAEGDDLELKSGPNRAAPRSPSSRTVPSTSSAAPPTTSRAIPSAPSAAARRARWRRSSGSRSATGTAAGSA